MNEAPIDLTVWRNRLCGMHASINQWLETAKSDSHRFDQQQTLVTLLTGLREFGKSQMEFFLDGLAAEPKYSLEPSVDFSWDYALGVTIHQIGYDMDVLTRAYQQRASQAGSDEPLRQMLAEADRLANAALAPAREHQIVDPSASAITYFQKTVDVRLIPYAPVSLVGIPYSAVASKRDLLMIPHEVGHYVFREGRVRSGHYSPVRLTAALHHRGLHPPAWLMPWLEEIFADIYGCLIGGPVMALSSQDLVMQDSLQDFTADDGEHPIPALRPEIYLAVLEKMGGYDKAVAKLRENWEHCLAERGRPGTFSLADGTEITMAQAKTEIKAVVETILEDYLDKVAQAERIVWSDELGDEEKLDALYDKFEKKESAIEESVSSISVLAIAGTRGKTEELHIVRDGQTSSSRKLGNTELWFDGIKDAARRAASNEGEGGLLNVPADVWLFLLTAGGWTTEGPGMPNISS